MGHYEQGSLMALSYFVVFCLLVSSNAQGTCSGAGSVCLDPTTFAMCTCSSGTTCAAAPDGSGSWTCQYSFCLPDGMFCEGNIGSCCATSLCEQPAGLTYKVCNPIPTTTTTTTSTDRYGNHVRGTWGDCDSSCPGASVATTPAPTCPTPCKFPFIFQGKVHYACTNAGGFSTAWCSTKTDAYGKHVTGNFADCGVGCPVEITG